jgi:hypothetical protein
MQTFRRTHSHSTRPGLGHVVARTRGGQQPFLHFETSRRTWHALQLAFPRVFGAVLMPNHIHLLLPLINGPKSYAEQGAQIQMRLGAVLSKTSSAVWEQMPPVQIPADDIHARRLWRYVMLNPCRSNLAVDPLSWTWSTLRDIAGASFPIWVSAERLNQGLALDQEADWFLDYVYQDQTVPKICGIDAHRVRPAATSARTGPLQSLETLLLAFAAALRVDPGNALKRVSSRRAFIRFAVHQGWGIAGLRHAGLLARFCGVAPLTVRRALKLAHERLGEDPGARSVDGLVRAGAVCLANPRLVVEMERWFGGGGRVLNADAIKTPRTLTRVDSVLSASAFKTREP